MPTVTEIRLATLDDTLNVPADQLANAGGGGGGGAPLIPIATVTVAGALQVGKHNPVDVTGGSLSMTLPTGQAAGKQISVEKEDATLNTVTVTGNIRGVAASSFVLQLSKEGQTFIADSAGSWWPTSGHKTLSSLDGRYLVSPSISNPTLTGTVTMSGAGTVLVPTPTAGDNSTKAASTAFIKTALTGIINSPAQVDMCAKYGHTPGTDVTADLNTEIAAQVTAGRDATIFWSLPGTHNINGSQTSGTAFTYAYSGQIIFPANTSAPVTIRIYGASPASPPFADADLFTAGTVLASNATSGKVFDAIPGKNTLTPQTQVRAIFENIWVTVPSDPQCSGIDGFALETLQFKQNSGIIARSVVSNTGTGYGIRFGPVQTNSPQQIDGYVQVVGFPTGVVHNEHFTISGTLQCAGCLVGVDAGGGGGAARHWSRYHRLLIQGCQTGIKATNKAYISGFLDIGDNGGWPYNTVNVVDDSGGNLFGRLEVGQYQGGAIPTKGFPVNGAKNLEIVQAPLGHRPALPYDDFTRMAAASGVNYIGACNTGHVWQYLTGAAANWTIGANSLKANTLASGSLKALLPYRAGRVNPTRNIHTVITPTGTFNQFVLLGNVVSGTNAGNMLYVQVNGGGAKIGKIIGGSGSQLAHTTSTALFSTGVQATLDVVYSNPIGGPASLTVVVNGAAQALTIDAQGTTDGASIVGNAFQLSASEAAALVDTDVLYTQDGIQVNELTSIYNYFAIQTA